MSTALQRKADVTVAPSRAESAGKNPDQIFLAVATLFEHQSATLNRSERVLAADILRRLSHTVEMSIRIALAERLADNPDAPLELITMLADDRIEIARPLLARSPVLSDADLLHVIRTGSLDHQVSVAERPNIGVTVSAALARSECEAVLIALLRNATAKIPNEAFDGLAERAHLLQSLQQPLVQRADLPPAVASRLYVWVSGALKTSLSQRYPVVANSLTNALDDATSALQSGKSVTSAVGAQKLVEKLLASGQLGPSFLVRVLNQGQMDLFEYGFAALLGLELKVTCRILYAEDPVALALACRAVGIDRAVFLTVFEVSRTERHIPASLGDADRAKIDAVFRQIPKKLALDRLKVEAA